MLPNTSQPSPSSILEEASSACSVDQTARQTRTSTCTRKLSPSILFGLSAVLLMALILRLPFIGTGLPYFSHEDEAHHYNRLVNMVKTGDLNPHYFHKPSLHFYLRIPAVAAGFLWSVREGHIRKVEEIQTEDEFGIAGYAFTVSHPGIVKWVRAESVLFSLLTVVVVFALTQLMTKAPAAAMIAALGAALAPGLVENSAFIGVDGPMTLLAILSSLCALSFFLSGSSIALFGSAIAAGLATSTKYNALPAIIIPFVALLLRKDFSAFRWGGALLFPWLAFLFGSPFLLLELPTFLNQLAYEIWHYGIAGHVGHTAEPGMPQLLFYLKWFLSSGFGLPLVFAFLGILSAARFSLRQTVTLCSFPILFLILMCAQRANFTRNVMVMLPYFAVCLGLFWHATSKRGLFGAVLRIGLILSLIHPVLISSSLARSAFESQDSRDAAFRWLHENLIAGNTAVSGQLQLPRFVHTIKGESHLSAPGTERLNLASARVSDLALQGFDRLVVGPEVKFSQSDQHLLELEKKFDGRDTVDRIKQNPSIKIYRIRMTQTVDRSIRERASQMEPLKLLDTPAQQEGLKEDYRWLGKRYQPLAVPLQKQLECQFMSPWPNKLTVESNGEVNTLHFGPEEVGKWKIHTLPPANADSGTVLAIVETVRVPRAVGLSEDTRRLGVAVRNCTIVE